jgi:hypothetical protein
MDTMGDAEQYDDDEELAPPREPWLTSEALAVTSLSMAMASLFITAGSQYVVFVLANYLGINGQNDQQKQLVIFMVPVGLLSFLAFVCGVTALKRRPEDRWTTALAVAGGAVGGVVLLMAVVATVVVVVHEPTFATE